jgi:hypothetical protein
VYKQLFIYVFILAFNQLIAQEKYFQQTVNFDIKVKLNDVQHSLMAFETIEYSNQSNQSLNIIYMHLWPNAFKNNHTYLAKQLYKVNRNPVMQKIKYESSGFIDSLDFNVDGKKVRWELCSGDSIDMARIFLNEALLPNNKIVISTPFFVKIPDGNISRFGHDYQQYYITQWYPKPAVFDIDGWHVMPNIENGEYFAEFGTFDVHISLPKNYVVGATGNLVDNKLEEEFIASKILETNKKSDFTDNSFPLSNVEFKTLHFRQDRTHDFAWFCDKRYNIQSKEVVLPVSNRKITCYALFTNEEQMLWRNATTFMSDAIEKLSFWYGEYPYDKFTAVEGINSAGENMEYPMLTIIGSQPSNQDLDIVLMHEMAHNWFPMMFANNERESPWLDEGFVSAAELRYAEPKYPEYNFLSDLNLNFLKTRKTNSKKPEEKNKNKESRYNFTYAYNYYYLQQERRNSHQKVNTNSEDFTESNYGRIAYTQSAILFRYLRFALGDDVYDDCFAKFYQQYKFKHVKAQDLQAVFENVSKKNLSWFFDDLVKTQKSIDYKFKSISLIANEYSIGIENVGEIRSPVIINALNINNEQIANYLIPGIVQDTIIKLPYMPNIARYAIDNKYLTPESNRKNNYISTSGIFKRIEPISLLPITYIEKPQKSQIFFSPAIGYNVHNGVMVGFALHNKAITTKKFEYLVMPMYATNSITPVGFANFNYNFNPKKYFRKLELGMDIKSYQAFLSRQIVFKSDWKPGIQIPSNEPPINILISGAAINYIKVAPYIDFIVKPRNANSNFISTFGMKANYIGYNLQADTILNFQNQVFDENFSRTVFQFHYQIRNKNLRTPYYIQLNSELFRTSTTAEVYWRFFKYKRGLHIRFFAGTSKAQSIKSGSSQISPFSKILNNDFGINSKNDFLFDDNYLGRYQKINSEKTIFNQWQLQGDGNIRIALYDYLQKIYSTNIVVSTNITLDIPKTPISLYSDLILDRSLRYGQAQQDWQSNYVFGVQLRYQDYFSIYLPISNSFNENKKYLEKIAFKVNLDLMNPFKWLRNEYQ